MFLKFVFTQFLNSYVRSRLTYSSQNWAPTKAQLNKLDSTYATFLRKMVRGGHRRKPDSYNFRLTNDRIYHICDTTALSTFISSSQIKYTAHVVRSNNTSIVKQLLFNTNKYSKRGQPTTSLLSQVLKPYGKDADQFYTKCHDRLV